MFKHPYMGIGHAEFEALRRAGYVPRSGALSPAAQVIYSSLSIRDLPALDATKLRAELIAAMQVPAPEAPRAIREALEVAMFEFEESRVW